MILNAGLLILTEHWTVATATLHFPGREIEICYYISMTHLFLAAVSSLYDPLATVKNTTCAPHTGCHTWASSRPVSVCWHSDTVWALFCCVGRLEEDLCGGMGCKWRTVMGPVVSEEPWLNMDRHTLCCITIAGECSSWLYPQPSPGLQTPCFLPRHRHSDCLLHCSAFLVVSAQLSQAIPLITFVLLKTTACFTDCF